MRLFLGALMLPFLVLAEVLIHVYGLDDLGLPLDFLLYRFLHRVVDGLEYIEGLRSLARYKGLSIYDDLLGL